MIQEVTSMVAALEGEHKRSLKAEFNNDAWKNFSVSQVTEVSRRVDAEVASRLQAFKEVLNQQCQEAFERATDSKNLELLKEFQAVTISSVERDFGRLANSIKARIATESGVEPGKGSP